PAGHDPIQGEHARHTARVGTVEQPALACPPGVVRGDEVGFLRLLGSSPWGDDPRDKTGRTPKGLHRRGRHVVWSRIVRQTLSPCHRRRKQRHRRRKKSSHHLRAEGGRNHNKWKSGRSGRSGKVKLKLLFPLSRR